MESIFEPILNQLHSFGLILLLLLAISLLVQIAFYLIFQNALRVKPIKNKSNIPVSVIISARNEQENLKNNLPAILTQNYSNFEVIVVNDCSTDNSLNILAELKQKYAHLNYTNIDENENFYHGKKLGLTIGVKAAKNDILILTDADCFPTSELWLQSIANNFNNSKDIILGYGGYVAKKGLLNKIIQYDTLNIAMHYMGLASIGQPYMGVGRNLAYRKTIFMKNKGFASHSHIISGDDDLFINEIANKYNTSIIFEKDSHTLSEPKNTYKEWFRQKRRHLSTGKYYKTKHKIILGTEMMSRFSFYFSTILLLAIPEYLYYGIGAYTIRLVIQLIVNKRFMNQFGIKKILFFSPILDMLIPLINLYLLFTNYLMQRNIKWK